MTSLDYGSQFAYFWQIHNIQEPFLTLKMRSPLRRCSDQRLLPNQEWLNIKNQDIIIHRTVSNFSNTSAILLINMSEKIKKNPWYFCIFVCLKFEFYMDSSTFCSCLAAFSCSSLKIERLPAGTVISMPSLCSFWLVSRLCLNNDICTCVLFWGWDWKPQSRGLCTGRWVCSFLFSLILL